MPAPCERCGTDRNVIARVTENVTKRLERLCLDCLDAEKKEREALRQGMELQAAGERDWREHEDGCPRCQRSFGLPLSTRRRICPTGGPE